MLLYYFQSSPPPMSPKGRTQDIDAIVAVIKSAEHFVHISVMDYLPLIMYTPKIKYVSAWVYDFHTFYTYLLNNQLMFKYPFQILASD